MLLKKSFWATDKEGASAVALTNEQYKAIIRGYEKTRDENRKITETRRELVYERIPEYRELDSSVGSIALAKTKAMLEFIRHISANS